MSNSLAVALGVRRNQKYSKGGPTKPAMDGAEEGAEESVEPTTESRGGMLSASKLVSGLMAKRMGKMLPEAPVEEDDAFSAETSMEGPLGEGEDEPNRQDKISMKKSMLDKIMYKVHASNKDA